MKVLTILGSPKKNGKTAKVISMLEKNLILQGHEMEQIHVADYKINGCLGCNVCHSKAEQPYCIQKDDLKTIFLQMMSADVIVYASPLYAFSFPAQMKSLIDRHYCFITNPGQPNESSVIQCKHVALLMTCCDPIENNADLAPIMFERMFRWLKCYICGKYIVELSYSPDFESRAEQISKTMAYEITKY
ncbi:MAG TPA: flavodoxin family protein [Firmicutes bacterium]|jgi:putative NADPH-quinone reductase|nr:flavodoxin family protein [Bacillota bacterium]